MRILFVCLGNICRSPLAEAVFNQQIHDKKLQSRFESASCGTANYHVGDPPDPRTIKNALKNGIKINHVGRQFDRSDFEAFDLIIPMDGSNERNILSLARTDKDRQKVRLMRSFDLKHTDADVPDPYMGDKSDFQEVFEIIDHAMKGLISYLEEKLKG